MDDGSPSRTSQQRLCFRQVDINRDFLVKSDRDTICCQSCFQVKSCDLVFKGNNLIYVFESTDVAVSGLILMIRNR